MPTQLFLWIIFTILILALVYYRLYKTENGNTLASLSLLGASIGFSAALAVLRSNTIYIQDSLLNNIIISIWALSFVLSALTFTSGNKQKSDYSYVNSVVASSERSSNNPQSALPGLIEQSVEALNNQQYDKAVNLLEKAIIFSEDLGTELKLRTELAFAYQLSGENDLAKEQLETGMHVARELGDSWVRDLSSAVEKLKENPVVKI